MAIQATGDAALVPADQPRPGIRLSGYISTAAISAANIIAIIVVTGILARAWDETQFLLYGKANRYMNFLFCIANGSLGFAIVRQASFGREARRHRILFNALCLVGLLSLIVGAGLLVFSNWIAEFLNEPRLTRNWVIPCVLWLFAQSFLHIMLAHLRSSDQLSLANRIHWITKTACVLAAALIAWQLPAVIAWTSPGTSTSSGPISVSVPAYYGMVGTFVLITCVVGFINQWPRIEPTLDPKLCGRMLEFSSTRVADALLKNSFLVLLITMLSASGSARIAGQIAVITFLLRGIEALCQPLVMLVMTDSLSRNSKQRVRDMVESSWLCLAIFTIPLMIGLYFFATPVVTLYLGYRYQALAGEFGLISLSLLPTVAVVLFRGHLDGQLKISPVMYANVIGLVAIGGVTWWLQHTDQVSLRSITLSIVVIRWIQFTFIMWVLRRTFGVALYRHSALKRLVQKVRSRF